MNEHGVIVPGNNMACEEKETLPTSSPKSTILWGIFDKQTDETTCTPDTPPDFCIEKDILSSPFLSNDDNVNVTRQTTITLNDDQNHDIDLTKSNNIPFLIQQFISKQRKLWHRRRIEQKISRHLNIVKQAMIDMELQSQNDTKLSRRQIHALYNPMTITLLISPLSLTFDQYSDNETTHSDEEDAHFFGDEYEESIINDEIRISRHGRSCRALPITIFVSSECPDLLMSSPRILTIQSKQQIQNQLPLRLQDRRWTRVFSASRDGDSFYTFLAKVKSHKETIIAVKTECGSIFGGFADHTWERQPGMDGSAFYGTGASFLFAVSHEEYDEEMMVSSSSSSSACEYCRENCHVLKQNVTVHKWTGRNYFNQLINVGDGKLAMGGGGGDASFGFCVEEHFTRGTTGYCETYGNPPLAEDCHFIVHDFEVYGFSHAWH